MNFEISLAKGFWTKVQEQMPLETQESVLDLLESMREHPGSVVDRMRTLPMDGVATLPIPVQIDRVWRKLVVVFQYDSDEITLHVNHFLILPIQG